MIALIFVVLAALASAFKSKRRLEAENAVLRMQRERYSAPAHRSTYYNRL